MSLPRQEWLESHYHWAANVVGSWVSEEIDIGAATLIDFGCGDGTTSLGVADHFAPKMVIGVDVRDAFKNIALIARKMTRNQQLPPNISFRKIDAGEPLAGRLEADVVFSWSCFEHIDRQQLPAIFKDVYNLLPIGGLLFLQIEPLYFSPHGAHLMSYIEEPWRHLQLSDEELRALVLASDPDIANGPHTRNQAVPLDIRRNIHLRQYASLNRVTADEIVQLGTAAGFEVRKQLRTQVELEPPAALVAQYGRDVLVTNEMRILFRKTRGTPVENFMAGIRRLLRPLQSLMA